MNARSPDPIDTLAARHQPGLTLEQPFYCDAAVFERELDRLFLRDWLYAGHVSQIPEPGDWLTYDIAGESVIVARDADGDLRAMVNVCRHRGSRICSEAFGKARRFVCPYHGWTYELDGTLARARGMPPDFDAAARRLHPLALEEFHGMVFVSFAERPAPLDTARAELDALLAPFALHDTRVAAQRAYPVEANWKLAVENFEECYHCAPAHPEFARSHSIKAPPGTYPELAEALAERSARAGTHAGIVRAPDWLAEPEGPFYYYSRYPLFDGYLTGSEDGRPLAPLLGQLRAFDGGASDGQMGLLCYWLVYSDHCVIYRFTPVDVDHTDMDIVWLVRSDAVEGRDYDLERLAWLWHVTTEADKRIIEHNQQGVNSRFYRPGPYAPMEWASRQLVDWYLLRMGEGSAATPPGAR